MLQPLDGPTKQYKLSSVGTATVVEIKDGGNPILEDRKVVSLEADGKMKVFFGDDDIIPSAATVDSVGFNQPKDVLRSYEAGQHQRVWILATAGTIDVIVAERG